MEYSAFHYQHLGYSSVSECLRLRLCLRVCVARAYGKKLLIPKHFFTFLLHWFGPHLAYIAVSSCAPLTVTFGFGDFFTGFPKLYAREPCTLLRWQLL